MCEEKKCEETSWKAFEKELGTLFSKTDQELLFRGHSDSAWELETTLDRKLENGNPCSVLKYYSLMLKVLPRVEEETRRQWPDMPNITEYGECLDGLNINLSPGLESLPGYEFMSYLRHHGFPSPLLDWTKSPYIAAFFAFGGETLGKYVAVYVYQQRPRLWTKAKLDDAPAIHQIGNNIKTHKRHFLQQSQYTMCIKQTHENDRKGFYYSPHEGVVKGPGGDRDVVRKYCIPSSEREEVLTHLRRCNINSFSLFGTEESLMNTLWSDIGSVRLK